MVTRGVASVRSPVKNLQEFCPTVTHDKFVRAMVQAFREEYHLEEPVRPCRKSLSFLFADYILSRYNTWKQARLQTYRTSEMAWQNSL
jgi:lipoate-protein ligase A